MTKIFIDGSAGTTGLQIHERLKKRNDITLLKLNEDLRKDIDARKNIFNEADIVFLCLPDDAAVEAVNLVENNNTVIIDTSTAHRVSEGWVYGLPEIKGQRELIKASKRIANPGCHASGFIALVAPLVENKILSPDEKLTCFSLTGYSGGGKKMIAQYENQNREKFFDSPRQYALSQNHKHLPEMMKEIYKSYYQNGMIKFSDDDNENGFLAANSFSGRDDMEIKVLGNNERILLIARFDNLGKGASGAAVQNMNLVMGINEFEGLNF